MNALDRIEAALGAKRVADTMLRAELDFRTTPRRIKARDEAQDNLHALLTDDTIGALIAVAEAACITRDNLFTDEPGWDFLNLAAALAPLMEEVPDES